MNVNNEVTSLLLQRSMVDANQQVKVSMAKIAHGKQTSAVEDAAGLIISENLEAKRRGSMEAAENVQSGLNMLATAESGLGAVTDNLQRVRELALQRENGTYGDAEKAAIDQEINALTEEIDRVSKTTSFNGHNLLDGSSSDTTLQIDSDAEAEENSLQIGSSFSSASSDALGLDPNSPDFLKQIDSALSSVSSQRSGIGALQNTLESTVTSLNVKSENLAAAQSRIIDTDIAEETAKLAKNQILQNSSAMLMAQANQSPGIAAALM